ncbi:MAG: dicarboxylate/amino acid:cation symporter [Planctomycetes bacterium]|nr:dicarboxylate/amino acid:cation symporter [Planctomycetota bacterium]
MNRLLALSIVFAMLGGIAVGWGCHTYLDAWCGAGTAKEVAGWFKLVTDVFLRMIKMIIAPLVFSTLVAGIAHMEGAGAVGRIGVKTLLWFVMASIVSLTMGLLLVHLLQPGVGLGLTLPTAADVAAAGAKIDGGKLTIREFLMHVFPSSIIDAMARNEILQIVVFSIFVGVAVASLDDAAHHVVHLADQVASIMLKVTGYVMLFAPVAIFAALAQAITEHGLGILGTYAQFVGGFYFSLALLWVVLIGAASLFVGKRALELLGLIRGPLLLAFSTASSEAAYPRTLAQLQTFGVSKKVSSFVLPLGYSFNLDGSMMYCTFATLFIAQAYGVSMSIGEQLTMLFLLMITSKGMAGVPRASLVVIAATLTYFQLPEQGLLLILAVDFLLDMGRSATNVVGNSVASVVVARWEGERVDLAPEQRAAAG